MIRATYSLAVDRDLVRSAVELDGNSESGCSGYERASRGSRSELHRGGFQPGVNPNRLSLCLQFPANIL